MNYMGIDIGTSGCKAVVFDENGKQLASGFREYDVIFTDDGGAELNADEVIDKCFEVIQEAAVKVEPGSVKGLGISSQGEAFTAIDKHGKSLSNAMVSSDVRSEKYANEWPVEFGEEKLYQITGHTAHPLFTLFKILWLKDNKPEVWDKADKFLCFEDLMQFRLGIDPGMGWSLAGRTMLFDVREHKWSSDILDAIGLSADRLARILPSGSVAGTVPEDTVKKLGLADGAFVVTGGHDQPCGALGAGVTQPGVAMYATGTVECITPAFSEAVFTEDFRRNNICTYDHAVPGMYITVAYSLTGGNILKWFRDEFGAPEVEEARKAGVDVYDLLMKAVPDKPSRLMVLPYFTPSGTPYFDIHTKGAVLGLRLSTTRGEFLRGLLEGVVFEMKLNLDILERSGCVINELRAIGGGAKSRFWIQLKADVLGKPITTLSVSEAGCLGVALLACAADTGRKVNDIAKEWVEPKETIQPRPDYAKYYQDRFETYRSVYPAIKSIQV